MLKYLNYETDFVEYAPIWKGDIDTALVTDVGTVLRDHSAFFRPHYMDWFGLAIFAKKELDIREEGDIFVFKEREDAFKDDEGGTVVKVNEFKILPDEVSDHLAMYLDFE